jgi:hypothetical protein
MLGSRSKLPGKKSRQAALRGGFNSGVKGLSNVSAGTAVPVALLPACLTTVECVFVCESLTDKPIYEWAG